ncbi:hypothetical protein J6590_077266 [Homalodisca vitripennis]|nr:hypothetical protein J6590_077266 [Homalodisca vitripennis]
MSQSHCSSMSDTPSNTSHFSETKKSVSPREYEALLLAVQPLSRQVISPPVNTGELM